MVAVRRRNNKLAWLLILLAWSTNAVEEVRPQHGGSLEAVDMLQNGSIKVSESYDAVNLNEAATKALPDDQELQNLLHWAISEATCGHFKNWTWLFDILIVLCI
jgi:hypothetical protein